ncbi:DNA polymerase III subunit delta [Balneolales bacterium ANBcel1]|nr:DNA polymerase III subunit delta [Balneolales bacterium ANBcel1]
MAKPSSLEHYKNLLKELQGPELKPVYGFFGEESFFLDRLQDAAESVVPDEARDFNLDILYGEEFTLDKLIGICRSYPMMAERRVVIVRDFMKLFARDSAGKSEQEDSPDAPGQESLSTGGGSPDDLVAYLNQPNPTTTLVLVNDKRPAATTKIGKALRKSEKVTVHTFEPVPDYRLQQWITEWARSEHQLGFEDSATQLLAYHVGNNLQQLTVEIEKLSTYRTDQGAITVEDVRQVVGLSREFTMFDFSDALMERNTEKAMFVAHQMIGKADSPAGEVIKMIGFLYTTFGKIWHIQRLSRKGLTPDQIRDHTGINSTFYYKKLAQAGRHYSLASCPHVFETLLDADKAIKGFSKESPEAILLMTVKKLTA